MKTELKQKWVKALRSGEYKQGRDRLRDGGDRYCCLGVLCDVLSEGEWERDPVQKDWWRKYGDNEDKFGVPRDQRDSMGLSENIESFLIGLNDSERKTFEEIADWIEENIHES